MYQAWLSIAGLWFDIVGFLLIAREWWLSAVPMRLERLQSQIRFLEDAVGRGPAQRFSDADRRGHDALLSGRQRQVEIERGSLNSGNRRESLFFYGAVLIVTGFVLQVIANALPILGV